MIPYSMNQSGPYISHGTNPRRIPDVPPTGPVIVDEVSITLAVTDDATTATAVSDDVGITTAANDEIGAP
jgi:hypothetical protein